jgi:hypothetical protein
MTILSMGPFGTLDVPGDTAGFGWLATTDHSGDATRVLVTNDVPWGTPPRDEQPARADEPGNRTVAFAYQTVVRVLHRATYVGGQNFEHNHERRTIKVLTIMMWILNTAMLCVAARQGGLLGPATVALLAANCLFISAGLLSWHRSPTTIRWPRRLAWFASIIGGFLLLGAGVMLVTVSWFSDLMASVGLS